MGGKIGSRGAYRVFADGFQIEALPSVTGSKGKDDWNLFRGGFRTDTNLSTKDSLVFEGSAYRGSAGELTSTTLSLLPPVNTIISARERFSGGHLLSRWNRADSPASETSLQIYFDHINRADPNYGIGLSTFNVDFQHHVGWGNHQDFVWGLGYRLNSDDTITTLQFSLNPADRLTQLFSSFVQDEITLRPNRIYASLGARLEHNDYTGFDLEPSARITWTPTDRNMFWTTVSGADRTPARTDVALRDNIQVLPGPNNLPLLISLLGNPNQKDEHLTAVETGYRNTLSDRLSLDSTIFFDRYRHFQSVEPGIPRLEMSPEPTHVLIPLSFANLLFGETHGMEAFANWKVTDHWTLSPGYSFLTMHMHRSASSQDLTTGPGAEGGIPNHQAQLRSRVDLPGHWQWNTSAYFVGRLPAQSIPSYTRVDTGLNWQLGESLSLSLVGQNLLKSRHLEYSGPDSAVQPDLIRRDGYIRLTWHF